MAVLGGSVRLELIKYLAVEPMTVGAIAKRSDLAIATVSKQLHYLKEHALVDFIQDKKRHIYKLSSFVEAHHEGCGQLCLRFTTKNGAELCLRCPMDESLNVPHSGELRGQTTPSGRSV